MFFECPPTIQVWALSKIPSNPDTFLTKSLFTNMDHLFWRVLPQMEDHQFAWILWYIWKGRNNNFFSNLDIDPMDTLKLAETESTLWVEAQVLNEQRTEPRTMVTSLPTIPGRWCFIDGVVQMVLGKRVISFPDKNGLVRYQVLMVYWGRGMFGLSSLLFMRRWKRYYGQWNV